MHRVGSCACPSTIRETGLERQRCDAMDRFHEKFHHQAAAGGSVTFFSGNRMGHISGALSACRHPGVGAIVSRCSENASGEKCVFMCLHIEGQISHGAHSGCDNVVVIAPR